MSLSSCSTTLPDSPCFLPILIDRRLQFNTVFIRSAQKAYISTNPHRIEEIGGIDPHSVFIVLEAMLTKSRADISNSEEPAKNKTALSRFVGELKVYMPSHERQKTAVRG